MSWGHDLCTEIMVQVFVNVYPIDASFPNDDLFKNKSGCCCVGHGRGFYMNTSALAANILFGI